MFKILSELHANPVPGKDSSGNDVTVYEPDWEKTDKDESTMGVKKIDVASAMTPEDQRAFRFIQKNVEDYKKQLKAVGKTDEADAIPDQILNPPEFVLGCYAYTFRKTPDSIEDLVRVRGTMSAIKGRNKSHVMSDDNINQFVQKASSRLVKNIHKLLTNQHEKLRKSSDYKNVSKALADIAVTSSFNWLSKLDKKTGKFPSGTVLVPLGSSSGLVGKVANELSTLTDAPIIHGAFIKSNNPRLSAYTWTKSSGAELRIGNDFLPRVINNDYGGKAVTTAINDIKKLLTVYMNLPSLENPTISNIKKAIDNLKESQQLRLLYDYKSDPRLPAPTDKKYNTKVKRIQGLYNGMLQELRIALAKDFDEYNEIISGLISDRLKIKSVPANTAEDKRLQQDKLDKIDNEIQAYRNQLSALPLPILATSNDVNKASYDQLKKTLQNVHKFLDATHITKKDLNNDDKLRAIQSIIYDDFKKSTKNNLSAKSKGSSLSAQLQDLYLLLVGKVFKYSGAQATVGGDFNKGFSRFQLANLDNAKQLNGKHIVIVDDNISSGGTVKDAVISLYANGIVPLSILVIAPHLLDNKAPENLTDMTDDELKALRKKAMATIDTGDAEARREAMQKIRDEVTLGPANFTGLKTLAQLALDILNGDLPFKHIIDAHEIIPNPFMYDNYIDTIIEMGKAREDYKSWYNSNSESIKKVKQDAQKEIELFTNNRNVNTAQQARKEKLRSAALATPDTTKSVATTASRIATLEKHLEVLKQDRDPREGKVRNIIAFLKLREIQEKGGYHGADLDAVRVYISNKLQKAKNWYVTRDLERYENLLKWYEKMSKVTPAVPTVPGVSTASRIADLEKQLKDMQKQGLYDEKSRVDKIRLKYTIAFLKRQKMQEDGGYSGADLDEVRQRINYWLSSEYPGQSRPAIDKYYRLLKQYQLNSN